jgi:hypothetical protein
MSEDIAHSNDRPARMMDSLTPLATRAKTVCLHVASVLSKT